MNIWHTAYKSTKQNIKHKWSQDISEVRLPKCKKTAATKNTQNTKNLPLTNEKL